ncbi:MAG TPA: tRNA pseudouridine(38-40) synthase TruA [Alphaproteobacteria bacterium]
MTTQRWKLTIEYDGTPFNGWQRQEDSVPSVQAAIEDGIYGFCQQRLTIHVAGRTDAGVHAKGQICHVDLPTRAITEFELAKAITANIKSDAVAVLKAEKVSDDFHARFSATNKLYTYRILRRSAPPALDKNRVWHFRRDLNVNAMQIAAKHLLGNHDFTTFRDSDCQAKSPVKTLDRLDIEQTGDEILFHAEGRSFLHHQVRNMVGTLTLVGDGKWQPDDMRTALEAHDRTKGGPTAPAEGLYLVRVDY